MQKGIIKNVNKLTGEPIDAKDLASLFSGIIGDESGVLTVFDELRLEKISDNKVRLHSGVYSLKGHILYIPKGSYEDFEIESGTLGANRIDLLVAEYVKNGEGDGEDTLHFRILKGETASGTPQAPELTQQDINSNGVIRQEILYELRLSGISLAIAKRFDSLESVKSLEDRIERAFDEQEDRIERAFESLIESGNDSKGSWIKFPDGTMICRHRMFDQKTTAKGSTIIWAFPQPFVEDPMCNILPYKTGGNDVYAWGYDTTRRRLAYRMDHTSTGKIDIPYIDLIAIGRWK